MNRGWLIGDAAHRYSNEFTAVKFYQFTRWRHVFEFCFFHSFLAGDSASRATSAKVRVVWSCIPCSFSYFLLSLIVIGYHVLLVIHLKLFTFSFSGATYSLWPLVPPRLVLFESFPSPIDNYMPFSLLPFPFPSSFPSLPFPLPNNIYSLCFYLFSHNFFRFPFSSSSSSSCSCDLSRRCRRWVALTYSPYLNYLKQIPSPFHSIMFLFV